MPNLTGAGQVETRADGSKVFTHGHRAPDNVQIVTQEYDPQGRMLRVRAEWSGFAGKVLDVTATCDPTGRLLKEEGYRAPDMKTPLSELLRPLPQGTAPTTTTSPGTVGTVPARPATTSASSDNAPITVPSLSPVSGTRTANPASRAAPATVSPDDGTEGGVQSIYGTPAAFGKAEDKGADKDHTS
ncbi:hypothetical protein [Deinococcus sp.]|uniref:hypothetical protein n=1 Tax=Deinococcus sp. TaxID=47478 RepID=UPI0025C117C9|nr:hypothetical protein [Deinococcus sp.]